MGGSFQKSRQRSFLFFAVELPGRPYSRRQYARLIRKLHQRFALPAIVLFRNADGQLTLALVYHRPNQRKPKRDVLSHVSLVREIHPLRSHRVHLDILVDWSLESRARWMRDNRQPRDFDGLLQAWLDALDTQELHQRFYCQPFAWLEPAGAQLRRLEEHLIRPIIRLLFLWFLKEKNLVAKTCS